MIRDATFYFANLGADVSRCITAAKEGNETRYEDSLSRAHRTLELLHNTKRPEAYEEGLLMLRGLALARETPESLASFQTSLDSLISAFSVRLAA
ncbi:hypothetical protein A3A36_01150 [Candidatus Kaiserbacteria bacterium RIFCSPLOWO2_01_FULL_52_12b]|uniref:DUF403 domain-containing protein n=1 Tax=Candidatus Kaiserbacteria bacterium RIFCSPLOWO2_01_FULL_52_12b TaxID=1798509 RepID=A0A1F6EX09_9BACT|nr:MAG: hypothetical protein A3A36_01150 [Candidatus Kaiserbacteria bacterium RIFCSPLOWO2_01_FULL_52_12b]